MGIRKSFRKAVRSLIRWAQETPDEPYEDRYSNQISPQKASSTKVSGGNALDSSDGLNFSVFNASGGKIIKVHSYDKRLDRTNSNLYIVTEQEDLGEELAQIITRESLTR